MNIYWPIYLNIESEINKLMYAIHMDDSHLNVHSSTISDLILRCCAEIESLAKELYKNNGGPKKSGIKYDYDALNFLDDNWMVSKKKILISSINCFFSKVEIAPFAKDTPKTDSPGKLTYMWNNAYQNLKHDRRNGLQYGNVAALFSAAAALYILNIYFKDMSYDIGSWHDREEIDPFQGSSIFSVSLHPIGAMNAIGTFFKGKNFDESIYTSVIDDDSAKKARELMAQEDEFSRQYITKGLMDLKEELVGKTQDEIKKAANKLQMEAFSHMPRELVYKSYEAKKGIKIKAVLNKNQF